MAAIEPKSPHTEEALFLEGPPDLTDDVQEGSHQQQGLFHEAGSFSSLQGLQQGSQIIGGIPSMVPRGATGAHIISST